MGGRAAAGHRCGERRRRGGPGGARRRRVHRGLDRGGRGVVHPGFRQGLWVQQTGGRRWGRRERTQRSTCRISMGARTSSRPVSISRRRFVGGASRGTGRLYINISQNNSGILKCQPFLLSSFISHEQTAEWTKKCRVSSSSCVPFTEQPFRKSDCFL